MCLNVVSGISEYRAQSLSTIAPMMARVAPLPGDVLHYLGAAGCKGAGNANKHGPSIGLEESERVDTVARSITAV